MMGEYCMLRACCGSPSNTHGITVTCSAGSCLAWLLQSHVQGLSVDSATLQRICCKDSHAAFQVVDKSDPTASACGVWYKVMGPDQSANLFEHSVDSHTWDRTIREEWWNAENICLRRGEEDACA